MAKFKNCTNFFTNCCAPCNDTKFKENCKCEGCSPLTVSCSNIELAQCIPILTQQIYDCICLKKDETSYDQNFSFKVISGNISSYNSGDPVCIKQIGLSYDYIGLDTSTQNQTVTIDGTDYLLNPISTVTCQKATLFNELEGTVSINPCCCDSSLQKGSKLRIIEKNRTFFICNLKIIAKGFIGCKTFTAVINGLSSSNFVTLSNLGFNPISFAGKLCWPKGLNRLTLTEKFDSCLSIDCVAPTSDYTITNGVGVFNANIDFSFNVNKTIYASNSQALAIFSTPNASICRNGKIINSCLSKCPNSI